jgi:hypothetical protein
LLRRAPELPPEAKSQSEPSGSQAVEPEFPKAATMDEIKGIARVELHLAGSRNESA